MFAIATLIVTTSKSIDFTDGILYPLPVELCDPTRLKVYAKLTAPGWGVSEFGYSYFAISLPRGRFLIFPGLMIKDGPKVTKKFYGYTTLFTRRQIENMAESIIHTMTEADRLAEQDQRILVHDLKGLSATIYHSATEGLNLLDLGNVIQARKRILNVIATQGMLKMRTDALDFLGNATSVLREEDVEIFPKVDKVVRCFKSRAFSQNRTIELSGECYRRVRGPDISELIAYGLIDNALKYSPERGNVDVEVIDGNIVTISITSMGPRITDIESGKIFDKGFRGAAAQATMVPGSGIGRLHGA